MKIGQEKDTVEKLTMIVDGKIRRPTDSPPTDA